MAIMAMPGRRQDRRAADRELLDRGRDNQGLGLLDGGCRLIQHSALQHHKKVISSVPEREKDLK